MLTSSIVLSTIALFFLSVYACIWATQSANYGSTKAGFLVSNRDINYYLAAISAGIGWFWAPAFFISTYQAYYNGLIGALWFSVGNILSLIIFSYGAQKIRDRYPTGFTITDYIREKHGIALQLTYTAVIMIIAIITSSYLLLALVKTLSIVTGVSQLLISFVTMLSVFLLSFGVGFRASIFGDLVKFIAVYIVLLLIVGFFIISGYSINLEGIKQHGLELIGTQHAWTVFATFGGAFFLSNILSPWVDTGFTQIAYSAQDKKAVGSAFKLGAAIFAGAVILALLIGFMGASVGVNVPKGNELYYLVYAVDQLIGRWALVALIFAVFAGLIAVIDTFIMSISSIVGNDLAKNYNWSDKTAIYIARISIIIFSAIVLLIMNSGADFLWLMLASTAVKCAAGFTVMIIILKPEWINVKVAVPLLLFSAIVTLSAYIISSIYKIPDYQLWVSYISALGTPAIALLLSYIIKK